MGRLPYFAQTNRRIFWAAVCGGIGVALLENAIFILLVFNRGLPE
jgi:hypothetical protein